jgi:hypothetical protein
MTKQLTLLAHKPESSKIKEPKNGQAYRIGDDIQEWMHAHYSGNKPRGGIWSSTFTPKKPEPCAWVAGMKTHPILREIATESDALLPQWILEVNPSARVCRISSLGDALYFQRLFGIHPELPLPPIALRAEAAGLTTCQTDWEAVGLAFDGVHLDHVAVDEIEIAHLSHGIQTPFDTWNCESTFWFRWSFVSVSRR